jgi:hypothetical protein
LIWILPSDWLIRLEKIVVILDNLGRYCDATNVFIREWQIQIVTWNNRNSNMTSFFRFVNKRAIYRLSKISFAHAPVHVTDFPVVNVHVGELSSGQIWQHKLCATLSGNVNINYRLPIKVYCRICTLRQYQNRNNHGSQNVFWVLTWSGGYYNPPTHVKTQDTFWLPWFIS